ncbi:MAG: 3-dehydroquinate synthase II [Candidatus Methanoplasma sp.]|nr:3-dehydroquinate synthase II [Candidatus Methanoplasma sp.]
MSKEIIVMADGPDDKEMRKELILSALESGIVTAVVRPDDGDFKSLGNVKLLINNGGIVSDSAIIVQLNTPEDQDRAMSLAGKYDIVILGASDWTVIPLENMIARFRGTGTKIYACASDPDEAKLYLQTLEKGVDGIAVAVKTGNDVRKFSDLISSSMKIELTPVEVTGVKNIEMGDRVCVDTVSMMSLGEGMLIGSQASCLFLVQSESEDNGYVAARPFRVNAGAVHAYVMGPEGKTRYLSEYRSGDPIMLVDSEGNTRISSVGRCKIEKRPLILLEATDGKYVHSTILQNAETVKLSGPNGSISVSKIKKGDKIFAKLEAGGRHFGMKIDESIREI